MESLNTLASSLEHQTSNTLDVNERLLTKDFRAAALSITTLYKASLQASQKAYDSGYSACLGDVLNFIQQGVSASHSCENGEVWQRESGSMTVGRVMDWVEARLEALGSHDDDDQDDDDRTVKPEKETQGSVDKAPKLPLDDSRRPPKEQTIVTTGVTRPRSLTPPITSPLSSPTTRAQPLPLPRRTKRARSKESMPVTPLGHSHLTNATPFTFSLHNSDIASAFILPDRPHSPTYHGLGKRRGEGNEGVHGGTATPGNRSHKRRSRHGAPAGASMEGMDVEEESAGRERKRQARR